MANVDIFIVEKDDKLEAMASVVSHQRFLYLK